VKWLCVAWLLLHCGSALAAFEVSRSVLSESVGFDPLRPAWQFWRSNPARLLDTPSRILTAVAQPYGLSNLSLYTVAVSLRMGPVGLGAGVTSMGTSALYQESDITVAGAWSPTPWLAIGVGTRLARIDFGGAYNPLSFTSWDAGMRIRISRQWSVDLSRTDLGSPAIYGRAIVEAQTHVALGWQYSNDLTLRAGSTGTMGQWTAGESLRVSPAWVISADLVTSPLRLRVGSLISIGALAVDLVYRDDPQLGGDVAAGLAWSW
jgi:hypothetical protein